ncbi:MAG: single-stranded-DNA-specific exonuclease RecJ [Bdellovibrionaceae bacterium]|jgi:single-stranded-DNA-specific exonuclease|nr:single-stranded-DNA-specific exonuclease RecJ [Pseudobdellovibrionaceae bacterium]
MINGDWVPKLKEPLPEPPSLLPDMIWQYLFLKGVRTQVEIDRIFSPSLKKLTYPFKILNMQKLVDRLVVALDKGERICIYGDFDLDGTSGVVLLLKGLEGLGYKNLTYHQPKRISEGYGVNLPSIQKLADDGVNVIVTVDVGITDVLAAKKAKELGMDFIITDHHLAKDVLPEAYTIVNPNQPECQSGLGFLCGAGVGFYVIMALKIQLEKISGQTIAYNSKDLLGYFTIATLTDMVPLVKENRVLIKHGLMLLENSANPGIKALMDYLGMSGNKLTSSDIAIKFAPKLNALSRLELDLLPIDIYLAEDAKSAKKLIKRMIQINEKRINIQRNAEAEAEKQLASMGVGSFVLVSSKSFHKGVIGLVATKLSKKHNVPAFIGAVGADGKVTGSSRLPNGNRSSLLEALSYAKDSLIRFGGHAPAAGFLFDASNEEQFRDLLTQYFEKEKKVKLEKSQQTISYDVHGKLADLNEGFMKWYEQLGPFGNAFEIPVFKFENLQLDKIKELKGGHLKLTFKDDDLRTKIDALWFSPPEGHNLCAGYESKINKVSLLCEPQWNYFNGRKTLQVLVQEIQWDELKHV